MAAPSTPAPSRASAAQLTATGNSTLNNDVTLRAVQYQQRLRLRRYGQRRIDAQQRQRTLYGYYILGVATGRIYLAMLQFPGTSTQTLSGTGQVVLAGRLLDQYTQVDCWTTTRVR